MDSLLPGADVGAVVTDHEQRGRGRGGDLHGLGDLQGLGGGGGAGGRGRGEGAETERGNGGYSDSGHDRGAVEHDGSHLFDVSRGSPEAFTPFDATQHRLVQAARARTAAAIPGPGIAIHPPGCGVEYRVQWSSAKTQTPSKRAITDAAPSDKVVKVHQENNPGARLAEGVGRPAPAAR